MNNKNPVFSRMEQSSGGSGFAYDEGRAAYEQAGQQPYQGQVPPQYPQGQYPPAPYPQGQYPPAPYPQAPTPYPPPAPYPPQAQYPVGPPTGSAFEPITDRMTLDDVIVRTGISLAVLVPAAYLGWVLTPTMPFLYLVAMFVGLGLGLVNTFKKAVSPALILAYAAAEGFFLGGISWLYQQWAVSNGYEGNLVSQAVIGTLVAFGVMLALYKSRIVKVDGRFAKIMMVAMVSYLVIALASFVASMFGVGGGWGFYGVGTMGLVLCMLGVALASFSLMLDFESITRGVRAGLPQREAWRMSFGLLVTLVWLYLEILRLLAIIASSRD